MNRRLGYPLLLVAWLMTMHAAAAAPAPRSAPPPEAWQRLQRKLQSCVGIHGWFEQVVHTSLRTTPLRDRGELWIEKSGRLRYHYQGEQPRDFIFDGHQAFFYEPAATQVTVFDGMAHSRALSMLRDLWRGKMLWAQATFLPCRQAANHCVRMVPKAGLENGFVALEIVVATDDWPEQVWLEDAIHNITEYRFIRLESVSHLDQNLFHFDVHQYPNLHVLHAPASTD